MNIRVNRLHFPVTTLGPGRRIGIWLQGCSLGCRGCVSVDTWEADDRRSIPVQTVLDSCRRLCPEGPDGITISGGEPFEQPDALTSLLQGLRQWRDELGLADLDLLCYSGLSMRHLRATHPDVLRLLDAVIPEPFLELRPIGARWRGSDNQPIVALSPLGERRYTDADVDAGDRRRLQVDARDGRLLFIGIPGRGDLEQHRRELAQAGISVEPGWQP